MAGLVPAIHDAPRYLVDMDARNKSGHDETSGKDGAQSPVSRRSTSWRTVGMKRFE